LIPTCERGEKNSESTEKEEKEVGRRLRPVSDKGKKREKKPTKKKERKNSVTEPTVERRASEEIKRQSRSPGDLKANWKRRKKKEDPNREKDRFG